MNNNEKLKQYFDSAATWETNVVHNLRQSARLAWIVAIVACICTLAALGAVAGLTPLKTVEPYVLRVDSSTGVVDIITVMKDQKATYDEVVSKYFLAQYLIHREHYIPETRKKDYKMVGLMSTPGQASKYASWYDPKSNPQAPLKLYDTTASAAVDIKNITFLEKDVALIRYSKTVTRANESVRSYWMATVSFDYSAGATMSAADRLLNPLGFQVREYRIDPETMVQTRTKATRTEAEDTQEETDTENETPDTPESGGQ